MPDDAMQMPKIAVACVSDTPSTDVHPRLVNLKITRSEVAASIHP
jgi:hypothetical protein